MKLSESQINKFIEIYYQKSGVVLNYQDALKEAVRLIKFIKIVESNID